jgi:hypothetical protein
MLKRPYKQIPHGFEYSDDEVARPVAKVDFDFESICSATDGEEELKPTTDALAGILDWCFNSPNGRLPPYTALLRFVVLTLSIHPALLDDNTQKELAGYYGTSRPVLCRYATALSDRLGVRTPHAATDRARNNMSWAKWRLKKRRWKRTRLFRWFIGGPPPQSDYPHVVTAETRLKLSVKAMRQWKNPAFRKKMIEAVKRAKTGTHHTAESRRKMCEIMKRRAATPEFRQQTGERFKRLWQDPAYRERHMAAQAKADRRAWRRAMKAPAFRHKQAEIAHRLWQNSEFRQRVSAGIKAKWKDPTYRAKRMAAIRAGA